MAALTIYPRGGQANRRRRGPLPARRSRAAAAQGPQLSDFLPRRELACGNRRAPRGRPTATNNKFAALDAAPRPSSPRRPRRKNCPTPTAAPAPQGVWAQNKPAARATAQLKALLGIGAQNTTRSATTAPAQTFGTPPPPSARTEAQLLADNRALAKRLRAATDLLETATADIKRLQSAAATRPARASRSRKSVTFANDDPETLMKPPCDTRVFFKDAAHNCKPTPPPPSAAAAAAEAAVQKADAAFLAARGASTAWRPKKRAATALDAASIAAIAPPTTATGAKASWGDRCEDEDDMFADGW